MTDRGLEFYLQRLGDQGWELVSVNEMAEPGKLPSDSRVMMYFFKRPRI